MRYYSHEFAHLETLTRARNWLGLLGFDLGQIEVNAHRLPRMTLLVEPEKIDEVRLLMDAAERTDPDGWPGFWDHAPAAPARQFSAHPAEVRAQATAIRATIGWHPTDRRPPEMLALRERWEV